MATDPAALRVTLRIDGGFAYLPGLALADRAATPRSSATRMRRNSLTAMRFSMRRRAEAQGCAEPRPSRTAAALSADASIGDPRREVDLILMPEVDARWMHEAIADLLKSVRGHMGTARCAGKHSVAWRARSPNSPNPSRALSARPTRLSHTASSPELVGVPREDHCQNCGAMRTRPAGAPDDRLLRVHRRRDPTRSAQKHWPVRYRINGRAR